MLSDAYLIKWTVKALVLVNLLPSVHIDGPKLVDRMLKAVCQANATSQED